MIIYIYEKNLMEQANLKSHFNLESFDVRFSSDVKSFLKEFNNKIPDLIIISQDDEVDIDKEVITKIKSSEVTKDIEILYLVESKNEAFIRKTEDQYGTISTVTKPTEKGVFLDKVLDLTKQATRKRKFSKESDILETLISKTNLYSANIKTHKEANHIISFLNTLIKGDENSKRAMQELIYNSIEHGIYRIGEAKKSSLLKKHQWEKELKKKEELHKEDLLFVNIKLKRTKDSNEILIIDPGKGFAWKEHMSLHNSKSDSLSGRGIAIAMSGGFDNIDYNDSGTQIKLVKKL